MEIAELTQSNMLDYAGAVNQARAIPDARTGLKPIHRKILYEMYTDKINSKSKYKKNAYMVGQIIARFSEHGDAGTYGALVRLGQNWVQRYPLLDFHGNAGSQFGDPPAAMRYTESRLSALAEEGFLGNLQKKNVDWIPNFTNEEEEPSTLPAIFPGLFCLPTQGIGYACACNFLTMNLKEVAEGIVEYIKTGVFPLLQYDLATGGTIINPSIMEQIYKTGKGTVIVEAKYEIKKNNIHITEIPFGIMFDELIKEIIEIGESDNNPGFIDVKNNSGAGKLEMIIGVAPKTNPQEVIDYLLEKTKLRSNYSVNQIALVDNRPKLLTQTDMAKIYVSHNIACIKREFEYDYKNAIRRIEILKGLISALGDIEVVIQIIRNSTDSSVATTKLKDKFSFTDNQIKAILDMKLARLSKLDFNKLNKELEEKESFVKYAQEIISNEVKRKEILIERLLMLSSKYGDKRRTNIIQKTVQKKAKNGTKQPDPIESIVVTYNPLGYLQRIPLSNYRTGNYKSFKITTADFIILFSNYGKFYRISAKDIKPCGIKDKGTAIGSIIKLDLGEKIIAVFDSILNEKKPYILFSMKNGYIKKTEKIEYIGTTRNLNGMVATKLKDTEIVSIQESNGDDVILTTEKNYKIRFNAEEVRATGKTSMGVKGISLQDNDFVKDCLLCSEKDYPEILRQKRAGKGKLYA